MKKFVCNVCGYVHEGDAAHSLSPVCSVNLSAGALQIGQNSGAASPS